MAETHFFAEMVDEFSGDLIESFGPYDKVGKAKAMCTRKHKATGETTLVTEYRVGDDTADGYVNDFLWPEVETNRLRMDEEETPSEFLPEKIIEVGDDKVAIFSRPMAQFLNRYFLGEALRRGPKGMAPDRQKLTRPPRSERRLRLDGAAHAARLKELEGVEKRRAMRSRGGIR